MPDVPFTGFPWLSTAAIGYGFFSYLCYPAVDDIGRAAAAFVRPYVNRPGRAVGGACATFHAAVTVDDRGLFAVHGKDALRADGRAIPAADARIVVEP